MMFEYLYSIDKWIFCFINQTLSNRIFDAIMPSLTDWNLSPIGIGLFAIFWLLLLWKGGKKGRTVALLLIPLIIMSDQLSSNFIKQLFARARPCHVVNGSPIVKNIHLLVSCGGGYSFPSSHAANNFAFATLLSFYFRRWWGFAFFYAGLMGLSRIIVGVHYPSDVLGGALIGVMCALVIILFWKFVTKRFPSLTIEEK